MSSTDVRALCQEMFSLMVDYHNEADDFGVIEHLLG